MAFTLGTLTLNVESWEGFDYPEGAKVVGLLSDGSSTTNAVIQQGALTRRTASISGVIADSDDLATLRGYYEAKTSVTFTDDDSNTVDVYVFDLRIARIFIGVWSYSATLIQAA